jgi:hypothetical protein
LQRTQEILKCFKKLGFLTSLSPEYRVTICPVRAETKKERFVECAMAFWVIIWTIQVIAQA